MKEFAHAAPGRRAAALAAVWIAATGCEPISRPTTERTRLRTYRLAESELRAELRLTMAQGHQQRAASRHPESMIHMLERLKVYAPLWRLQAASAGAGAAETTHTIDGDAAVWGQTAVSFFGGSAPGDTRPGSSSFQ